MDEVINNEEPSKKSTFVHLHNHTDFSLLDGAAPIAKYIAKQENLCYNSDTQKDNASP